MSVIFSGCATMRYPKYYKVEGREFEEFKELDDDRALKVVALIYNMKGEDREDGIARSLALDQYIGLIKKRRSGYFKNSGIFDVKYDKIDVSSWKDDELIKLYDTLAPRADAYYTESGKELNETENTRRIVYLTALNTLEKEMEKRESTRNIVSFASRLVVSALMIALSMI